MIEWQTHKAALLRAFVYMACGVAVGVALALYYVARTPVEYRSESTFILAPDSLASSRPSNAITGALALFGGSETSDIDIFLGQLRSRDFMDSFLQRHQQDAAAFRPYVGDASYRLLSSPRRTSLPPNVVDKFRTELFRITPSSSQRIFKLTVTAADPAAARRLAAAFLKEANQLITRNAMIESRARQNYLQAQLRQAQNVELRTAISQLAAEEIRKSTLISGSRTYGLLVIDRPTFNVSRAWPIRGIVLALGILNGAIGGLLLFWITRKLWR